MIDNTKKTKFLCIPADLRKITQKMLANDKLCRLLYITNDKALTAPNLTTEEKERLISDEYIQTKPKVRIDEEQVVQNYIIINFDMITPSENNAYLNGILMIDILCQIDGWDLIDQYGELTYRPYEIAQIVDGMIDEKKFSGIGTMNFLGSDQLIVATNDNYAGLSLKYGFTNSRYETGSRLPRDKQEA